MAWDKWAASVELQRARLNAFSTSSGKAIKMMIRALQVHGFQPPVPASAAEDSTDGPLVKVILPPRQMVYDMVWSFK